MTDFLMMVVVVVLPYLLLRHQPDWLRQNDSAADAAQPQPQQQPLLLRNQGMKPIAWKMDSSRILTPASSRTENWADVPLGRDRNAPLPPLQLQPLSKMENLDLQVRFQNLALATIEDRMKSNLAADKPAAVRP